MPRQTLENILTALPRFAVPVPYHLTREAMTDADRRALAERRRAETASEAMREAEENPLMGLAERFSEGDW